MIYFKHIFLLFVLSMTFSGYAYAFYSDSWKDICSNAYDDMQPCKDPKINQFSIDLQSVNQHNNSIYYAIRYFTNTNNGTVSIIQYKDGKIGMVSAYDSWDYDKIMQDHIHNEHPARTNKQAKEFKEIRKESLIYQANLLALGVIKLQKEESRDLDLLYHGAKNPQEFDVPKATATTNLPTNTEQYMDNMQQTIKQNWSPPKGINGQKKTVVYFELTKAGQVQNIKILKSSHSQKFDDVAIETIKKTKFNPLPKDWKTSVMPIEFTFELN